MAAYNAIFMAGFFQGSGYIAGEGDAIVTVAGVPASRTVLVIERKSLRVAARIASNGAGNYSIQNIDMNLSYIVIGLDYEGQFNAVIRDNVTPAPMP